MDRKIKLGITPAEICSIIFGIMGVIYFGLGMGLTQSPPHSEDHDGGVVFVILGGGFLLATIVIVIYGVAKRRRLQRIFSEGRHIWGEIADIIPNYNVRINGRNPYIILVRYVDRHGSIHTFRSSNLNKYPDRSIVGKQVKIYYENESYKHYYIDLEGVLPKVIEH